MNTLFLDIDGVLNSLEYFMNPPEDSFNSYPLCEFDKRAINIINKIIRECGISNLVISSDWRNVWTKEELINIFISVGLKIPSKVDTTECFINKFSVDEYDKIGRGYEIQKYINDNNIINYIIIDDDNRFLEEQQSKLILTSFNNGVQLNHLTKAKKILNYEGKIQS